MTEQSLDGHPVTSRGPVALSGAIGGFMVASISAPQRSPDMVKVIFNPELLADKQRYTSRFGLAHPGRKTERVQAERESHLHHFRDIPHSSGAHCVCPKGVIRVTSTRPHRCSSNQMALHHLRSDSADLTDHLICMYSTL